MKMELISYLVLILGSFSAVACWRQPECGVHKLRQGQRKPVEESERGEFPFLVQIRAMKDQGGDGSVECTGTVIKPNLVITSSRCDSGEENYKLTFGENVWGSPPHLISETEVEEMIRDESPGGPNLLKIELKQDLHLSLPSSGAESEIFYYLNRACYAGDGVKSGKLIGKRAIAVGWLGPDPKTEAAFAFELTIKECDGEETENLICVDEDMVKDDRYKSLLEGSPLVIEHDRNKWLLVGMYVRWKGDRRFIKIS